MYPVLFRVGELEVTSFGVLVAVAALVEAVALAAIAWALVRWHRARAPDAVVFGRYLVLAGATRFGIEFIRVNERLLGPSTLAHLISGALVVVGITLLARRASTMEART